MKTLYYVSTKLIIIAMACSFVASAPIQARSADNARLIVNRSADFGVDESVNLAIDGVQVAVLAFNQNYDAALPPGKHVLSITTNPRTYAQQPSTPIQVNAQSGETYTFTAFWKEAERASLVED